MLAPVAGLRRDVSEVPDPVFARGIVGPGAAIEPHHGKQAAVAPIDGTLVKVHPHAFLVVSDQGPGVLVHLGIDTVQHGRRRLHRGRRGAPAGRRGHRGHPLGPRRTSRRPGAHSMCAVVVLDCPYPALALQPDGADVAASEPLFAIDC